MRRIGLKKLYIYIIKTFVPLLLAGFSVSLFVVVIQFLWQSIGNLVGKGVDGLVLLKLLFFASMTMVPLALVLGVLVASLMVYGNLGERMEILAMKAAGIPLWKILKPVFYFVVALAVGLFIFQNDWMISSQVKFWQYYFSIKNKSPELAIPEGSFYKGVDNLSIYVERKDQKAKMMYGMMLYDYSDGFESSKVVVADSGRLYSTKRGTELVLELYKGESFQNLAQSDQYYATSADRPFVRERFAYKELHIPFNTDLSMMDESILSTQFVGKNVVELKEYTDSLQVGLDSIAAVNRRMSLTTNSYVQTMGRTDRGSTIGSITAVMPQREEVEESPKSYANLSREERRAVSLDARLKNAGGNMQRAVYEQTINKLTTLKNDTYFHVEEQREMADLKRKNEAEYWRKFTYPVACIAFFLIGAPLGALIRKGGMGVPFLVAVFFFIIFYILETFGVKMVREGTLVNWFGMWLPNFVLIPIGLGLVALATKDSNRLSVDRLVLIFKRYFGASTKRSIAYREVSMQTVYYDEAKRDIALIDREVQSLSGERVVGYQQYFTDNAYFERGQRLHADLERMVGHLGHSRDYLLVEHLKGYPYMGDLLRAWRSTKPEVNKWLMYIVPVGVVCYGVYLLRNKRYIVALKKILDTNTSILQDIERIEQEHKS